jgi:hypothetical protein
MMNRRGFTAIAALAVIIIIGGMIYLAFGDFLSNHGAMYEATITVTTVEVSYRKYIHTYVWTDQTVSDGENGMKSKQYFFAGTPAFEVGKTYHVKWHNEIRFHVYDLWYVIGVVDDIQVVN